MAENGGSEDRVKFQISVEGSEEAAEAFTRLGGKIKDSGDSAETASQGMQTLEDRQRSAAAAAMQATTAAIGFTTRLAGAANAVGELSAMMGSESEGTRLIGKIAATSAAMAQLGGTFGPTGAMVGGIVGATIPAVQTLVTHLDTLSARLTTVTERITTMRTDAHTMLQAVQEAAGQREESRNLERLLAGGGTDEDRAALRAEQQRVRNELNSQLVDAERAQAEVMERWHSALQTAIGRVTLADVTAANSAVNTIRSRLAEIEEQTTGVHISLEENTVDLHPDAHGGNTHRGGARNRRAVDKTAANEQGARNQLNKEFLDAQAQQELDYMNMIDQEQARRLDERATAELDYLQMIADAERDLNKRNADARAALDSKERTEREARLKRDTKLIESVAAPLGGLFAGAFEQAINGQEDFGKAFEKGSKQMLTQFGTQMVAEGAGALLTAAGLAVINPPAAGGKAIEGAGKLALGIGLGAAGAAIQTGGAEAPAANGTSGSQSGGSSTMVVNLNAPTVVGGTHAETGRLMGRSISESRARFNQRAA